MNLFKVISGIILSFVFMLFFSFIVYGVQFVYGDPAGFFISQEWARQNEKAYSAGISSSNSTENILFQKNQGVPALTLNAESAIVVKTNFLTPSQVIFEKDKDKQLTVASLTKLMTAVVAVQDYLPTQNIIVSKDASLQKGAQGALLEGDSFSVENLIYIMLIDSSNQAAFALSDEMGEQEFVVKMNQAAKNIGLTNTFFTDPTGLSPNDFSTSQDLVQLTEYILKNYPQIFNISTIKEVALYKSDGTFYGVLKNTNQLLGEIPEIIGGKTGFTTDAKGCLLLVTKNPDSNDYLFYVILGSGDRFGEMKKLINWVNDSFNF